MIGIMSILRNRWFVRALGVVLISLLVWFVGPLIAVAGHALLVEPLLRGVVILLLIIAFGVWFWFDTRKETKKGTEFLDNILDRRAGVEAEGDRFEVKEKLLAALAAVRGTCSGWAGAFAQRHVYALPWYVIVGPPGAGKTTALSNSGLKFPTGRPEALKGVGGTRSCEWWLTDEAILIDTAGRYTTRESDHDRDTEGWYDVPGPAQEIPTS